MATSTVDEPKLPGGYLVTPRVPQGLAAAVEGLTREVLRHSPEDIYVFAAHHFEKLLHIREQCGGTERVSEKNSNVRALREMSKALKMREADRGNAKAMKNAVPDQVGWSLNQTARVLKRHRSIFGDAGRRISTDEVFRMAKQKENRESSGKQSAEKGAERRIDRPTIEKTADDSAENVWKASTSRTERSEDSGDTNEMNSEARSGPRIITQIASLQSGTGMLAKDIKTELRKNRISSRERRSVRAKPEARSTVDRSGKNNSSRNSSERRTKGIETEIEKKRSSNGSSDSTRSSKDRQRTNGSENSDDKAKDRAIGMERVKDYVVQRFATTKSLEELQSVNYVEKVQEIIDETGPIIKGKVDELKSGMIGKSKRSSWFAEPNNATNKPSNGSQINSDNRRNDENQSELKSRLTETQCLLENVSSCLTRPHRRSRSARSSRRSKSSAATHEDLSNSTISDPPNRASGLEMRLSKTRNLLEDISSTLSKPMRRSCSAKTLRKYDDGTSDDSGEIPITRFDETGKLLEGLSAPFVVPSHRLGSAKGSRITANNDESSHSDSQSVSNVSLPAVRSISVKSSSGSVSRSVADNLILPAISPEAPKSAKIKEDLVLPILSPPGTASSTIEDSKISASKTGDVALEETDIPEIPVEEYIPEALVDDVFRDSLNVTPNFDGIPQRPDSLEPQETPEESREIASKIDDSEERLQENLEIAENLEDVDVSDIKNKLKELEEAERRIDRILDTESRNEAKESADSEREIDIPIADEPTVVEESTGNKESASDRLSIISPEFLDCTYVLTEGSPHDIPDTVTTVIIPERPVESPQSNAIDVQLKTDSPQEESSSLPESAKSSKKSIEAIETADSNESATVSSAHREDLEETAKTIDESSQNANVSIEKQISSPKLRSLSPPESAKSSKKSTEEIEAADSNESATVSSAHREDLEETVKTIDESSQNAKEPIEQQISSPKLRSLSPPESAKRSKKSIEEIEAADSNESEIIPSAPPEDLEETAKTIDESSQNANVSIEQRIPSPKMQTELFGELVEPDITEDTSPVMNINYIRGMENRHDIQIAHQDLGRINEEMSEELEDLRERDDPSKETEKIDGTEKISDETLKQIAEKNDDDDDDDDDGKEKLNVETVVDGSKEKTESDLSPMALRTELDSESSNEAKESSAADEPLDPSAKCGISLEDEEDASSETRTPESSNEVKETTLTDGLSLSLDPTRPYVPELNLDSLQELTVSSFKMTEDEYENQCKVESENTNSITETLTSDENNRTNDNVEFVEEYRVSSSERSKFHENSSREEVVEEPIVESRIEVKEDVCKKSKAYTMGTDDEDERNPTDETVTIRNAEKESQESTVDNDETKVLRSPEEGKGESSQISEVSEETLEKQIASDEAKITETDRKSRPEGEEQNLQISSENIEALRDGNIEDEEKNDEEEFRIKIDAKALEIDDKKDKSSLEDDEEKITEKNASAVDTPAESNDTHGDYKSEENVKLESSEAEIKKEETKEDESGSLEISIERPEVQTTIENTSEEGGNDESFVEEETPLAVSRSASQCTTRRVSSGNLTRLREDLSAGWSEQIGPEIDDEKDSFSKVKFSKIAGETIREQGSENDGILAKDSKEYHIYVPEVDAGDDYSTTESSSTVESAVTKIQARVRGFLTRRRLHRGQQNRSSTLNSIPSIQDSVAVEPIDKENDDNGLANAATTIQANYRRYKARNRLRREDAVHRTTLSLEKSFAESGLRHTGEFHDCIPLPIHDLRLQKGSSIVTTDGPSGSDKISESDTISINPHEEEIPSANNEKPVDSNRNDSEAKIGEMFFGQSANVPIIKFDMNRKISQLVDIVVLAKEEAALQSGYLNFITSVEDTDPIEPSAAVPIDATNFSGDQNNSNESTKEPLALSDTPLGVVIEEVTSSGAENFMKSDEPDIATESVTSLSSPAIDESEKKADNSVENSENPEENRVASSDGKKIGENLVLPTKSTKDLSILSENFSFTDEKEFLGPESSVDSMECPPIRKDDKHYSRSSDDRASQETPTSDRKIEKLETSPSDVDEPSSALSFSMKAEDFLGVGTEETSKPRAGKTILEVTLTSGDLMKSKSRSQESQLAGERIESPITMVQMTPGRSESFQRDDLSEGACDDEENNEKKPQTSAKTEK